MDSRRREKGQRGLVSMIILLGNWLNDYLRAEEVLCIKSGYCASFTALISLFYVQRYTAILHRHRHPFFYSRRCCNNGFWMKKKLEVWVGMIMRRAVRPSYDVGEPGGSSFSEVFGALVKQGSLTSQEVDEVDGRIEEQDATAGGAGNATVDDWDDCCFVRSRESALRAYH